MVAGVAVLLVRLLEPARVDGRVQVHQQPEQVADLMGRQVRSTVPVRSNDMVGPGTQQHKVQT